MRMSEYIVVYVDDERKHNQVKRYGTNVNNVMDEFYFENPDAFVVAVYKMLERDWGYKKK